MNEIKRIKLFLYTVKEYKEFSDYFKMKKEHSLLDGFTKEEYIAIHTKLIILRKYGSRREPVYIKNVLDVAKQIFPELNVEIDDLLNQFMTVQENQMQTFLSDGTPKTLYAIIEDVMYGLYLHADERKIEDLTKIDTSLLFIATRKYVEDLEKVVLYTYDLLDFRITDKFKQQSFEKAPVISVKNENSDVQSITASPYWSNVYGKDATDETLQQILKENTLEDNLIIMLCLQFIEEVRKDDYSVEKLQQMVFPPTKSDWGDFSTVHKAIIDANDLGWSTRVRYNEQRNMAYFRIMQNVQGAFTIDHPHVLARDISVITLVYENDKYGWRIFKIGEKADYYKEDISVFEAVRRKLKGKNRK